MLFLYFTSICIILIFLSSSFVLSGKTIYDNSFSSSYTHPSFKIGFSYFLGMGLFIIVFKTLTFVTKNALLSLMMTLVLLFVLSYQEIRKALIYHEMKRLLIKIRYFNLLISKRKLTLILLILLLPFFESIFYLAIWPAPAINDFGHAGSVHTGTYANVATYILKQNYIPNLKLHYGQSILTTVPMSLGFHSPILILHLWLVVSVTFLFITTYGFFRYFRITPKVSLIGTFIAMFGQPTLSKYISYVVDSGYPPALNGFTDSIYSIGSYLGFIVWLHEISCKKWDGRIRVKQILLSSLVVIVLGSGWNLIMPTNLVLAIPIMGLFILRALYKKVTGYKEMLIIFMIFMASVIVGLTQGGTLTPSSMTDNVSYAEMPLPSTMIGDEGISFKIDMALSNSWEGRIQNDPLELEYGISSDDIADIGQKIKDMGFMLALKPLMIKIINNLLHTGKIGFFSFLGLIMFAFVIKKHLDNRSDMKYLFYIISMTFLIGFCIVYFLRIRGDLHWSISKWPLSRFLINGYFLTMISLVISVDRLVYRIKSDILKDILWILLLILTTYGVLEYLFILRVIPAFNSHRGFTERIAEYMQISGMIQ